MESISIIAQFKKKNPALNYGTIYIRGYYNRRPVKAKSTGYVIQENHWDPDQRKVKTAAPNAALINTNLAMQLQQMQAQLMQKQIMGVPLNRAMVHKAVAGIDDSKDFIAYCRQRITDDYGNKETRRTYRSECTKMEQFRPVISFADIDNNFLVSYRNYMRDKLKNDTNTIWKSFKFINTMINKAIDTGGILLENPFKNFDRGKYEQRPKEGIEINQCEEILKLCLDKHQPVMLQRVAMYFLLMAYSGMRFSDAMDFNPDDHIQNGRFVMTYKKFNTNVNFEIWERLANIVTMVRHNRLKICNKEFNKWLKVVGGLCKIELTLTSHVGRHTMGGFLRDLDIPIDKAQVIMGHKDQRSTEIYFHIKNKTIDGHVKKLDAL